jgi:hypothetical protein
MIISLVPDIKRVNLALKSLLVHGETWYQRHLGAKPSSQNIRAIVESFTCFLKTKPKKGVFTFFKDDDGKYEDWYAMFATHDCLFFNEHQREIERVMEAKPLFYSDWYISRRVIEKYQHTFKVCKQMRGGYVDFPVNKLWFGAGRMEFTEED